MSHITIKKAKREEINDVLWFIRKLAEYEKMLPEVTATPEMLEEWIFNRGSAEVVFIEENDVKVGFVLYFYNFSTFVGKSGLYIEDLFVLPEHRGKGYGKALMVYLAKKAEEKGLGRMEWTCLDWNEKSIAFYKSLGAVPMDEWTNYRLTEDGIRHLAQE